MPISLLILSLTVLAILSIVGLRLLGTGIVRRSIPELALAAFFLLGGTVTFGFDLVAREFVSDSSQWQTVLRTTSNLGTRVPAMAIALFTWRVFRPADRWAAQLFTVIAGLVLGLSVTQVVVGRPTPGNGPIFWISILTTVVALGWAMADSFAYYRSSVRRLALGLTSAAVTNRFLLWSIWSGAAMLVVIGKVSSILLFDADAPFTPARVTITLFQSMIGLICVTALTLTFSPPPAYVRWIESRPEVAPATS
jgi:hypothetical protein